MSNREEDWRPSIKMSPHATFRHRVAEHELTDRITPTSDVFVLAHFGVARIQPDAWRLQVTGMVNRPVRSMRRHRLQGGEPLGRLLKRSEERRVGKEWR